MTKVKIHVEVPERSVGMGDVSRERRVSIPGASYLHSSVVIQKKQEMVEETDRLAYAIFSEYIPLTKNNTRVVTETERRPRVK